jgi:hypothetical protein
MIGNRVLFFTIIIMAITASCVAFAENQYADDGAPRMHGRRAVIM